MVYGTLCVEGARRMSGRLELGLGPRHSGCHLRGGEQMAMLAGETILTDRGFLQVESLGAMIGIYELTT